MPLEAPLAGPGGFNQAQVEALRKARPHIDEATLQQEMRQYSESYQFIPGAPAPGAVALEEMAFVGAASAFKLGVDASWEDFKLRKLDEVRLDEDIANPYLPIWFAKAEGQCNPWMSDHAGLQDRGKTELANGLRLSAPALGGGPEKALLQAPLPDVVFLDQVIDAVMAIAPAVVWGLGENDDTPLFRWAPCLCTMAGLGLRGVRRVASHLQNEPAWQEWSELSDDLLIAEILEARKLCGYPLGLLRLPWQTVRRVAGYFPTDSDFYPPRWLAVATAFHTVKHLRARRDGPGSRGIWAAYNGKSAYRTIKSVYGKMPLLSPDRPLTELRNSIGNILSLDMNWAAKEPSVLARATQQVLGHLRIDDIPFADLVTVDPTLATAPAIEVKAVYCRPSDKTWVDPGVHIVNVARLSPNGSVSFCAIDGSDVIRYSWPMFDRPETKDVIAWRRMIPKHIKPVRFSHVFADIFKNWNRLGCDEGAMGMVDGLVSLNLAGPLLYGTALGSVMHMEFPLISMIPMSGEERETTNQGKTQAARLLMGAILGFMPGDLVTHCSMSVSAPAQRTVASPLYKYGTAIFDEFRIPESPDHFLNASGLQTLATGESSSPGRAGENAESLKLRYPLALVYKVANAPPDIHNRTLPIFFDTLNDNTRLAESQFETFLSGAKSLEARWSHALWMQENGIYQKLREATVKPGVWRFPAHRAAAELFCSTESIREYLRVSEQRCRAQVVAAEESGLSAALGMSTGFRPQFYIDNVSSMTVDQVQLKCNGQHTPLDILTDIVENGGARKFSAVLTSCRINEAGALGKFLSLLSSSPCIPFGTKYLRFVHKNRSTRLDHKRNAVAYIEVLDSPV